ncbi:alpha-L-rhamnosidase-related protein [Mangrovibacterium diazotrophicum]|uniref:Alpha-L-rhamnosidase-like protein n=1 Tax=Mangrovibacterium diazotrophicum TaxID=1261403 RepID=A0A419W5J5_9BACT|nr:family 78 glycoside hydrolase catalytic domain [Mangrovibacterium diazotrophicum]RKD90706.1 alpha-L-rhamnosidase-like protein [Mangrovibacterium diazotrophicum]
MQKINYQIFILVLLLAVSGRAMAQNYYPNGKQWVEKAEALKPKLTETIVKPTTLVELVKNEDAFQGWEAKNIAPIDSLYNKSIRQIKEVVVDLGDHYTGYFTFNLKTIWGAADSPVRFRFTFSEVPAELATPFDPFPGAISRAWLQDEQMTIMNVPSTNTLTRRVSCRYIKIELLGASPYFDFGISDIQFKALTSAVKQPEALAASTSPIVKKIDEIGLKTLKECMQTVYEDGPKRDRRLWVGDMYLESLANVYSYENHNLTKRCLYILAGLSDDEGYVLGTIFEEPEPHPQAGQRLMDYSLLYNVSLKNYLLATDDKATAEELWPVAKRQLDIIKNYVGDDGLVDYERANKEWWLFFDWKDGLNKNAAIQGLMIFALSETFDLAEALGKTDEIAEVPALIKKMKKAALANLYNTKTGMFACGDDQQISYASQIWMILGGVLNEKQSQKVLTAVMNTPEALSPGGPYMYHYLIQALINSNMQAKAKELLVNYWGGMVEKGADTFWEVYDPNNDFLSPYNFFPINSYCHAWSCTPVYFIRKYPEIFQQ